MKEDALASRLSALERRVALLEQAAGVDAQGRSDAQPARTPPPLPPAAARHGAPDTPSPEAPWSVYSAGAPQSPSNAIDDLPAHEAINPPATTPSPVEPAASAMPTDPQPTIAPVSPAAAARAKILTYSPQPARAEALTEGAWEQTIGLKVAGWVGAIVLVIGAALGVKYGYERWVVNLPAEVRLATLTLFGVGLIAAGEWVYRRVHVWSAVGLFGAGVATLFIVAYAGHGYFDLYSRDTAFILMGLATLIGAAVAMRGRLVSIGVLSILGGHLAPLILGGDVGRIVEFLSYVLMLQVVALVLAAWGNSPRWWTLRWLSLVTTGLWALSMVVDVRAGQIEAAAPLGFILVYAALFLGELAVSTLRSRQGEGGGEQSVVLSLCVTGGLLAAMLITLHDIQPMARGAWVIGFAVAEAALGWALALRHRRLDDGRGDAMKLSLALRIQAAGLVVVAVPVALGGPAVTLVWALMALAFAAVGRRLDLRIAQIAAVITWVLAVAYMPWCLGSGDAVRAEAMRATVFTLGQVPVPMFVVLSALAALIGQAIAWLIERPQSAGGEARPDDRQGGGVMMSVMAGGVWVAAAIAGLDSFAAALAIVGYAWLLALGDRAVPRLKLAGQALAAIGVATIKWLLVDLVAGRISGGWGSDQLGYAVLVNPMVAMGLLLAGSMVAICLLRRSSLRVAAARSVVGPAGAGRSGDGGAFALGAAVITMLSVVLSMEIDRGISAAVVDGWRGSASSSQVKLIGWTILWSLAMLALGGWAWRLESDRVRRHERLSALGMLTLLLMGKYVLVDTLLFWLFDNQRGAMGLFGIVSLGALCVLATLAAGWWALRRTRLGRRSLMSATLGFAAMLLVLYVGTLEIDHAFSRQFGTGTLAVQVAWSIWWSIFAVISVTGGFAWRLAAMRYFGLGLFAVTVLKVFLVDLQGVSSGWRTLSFVALGLLLIGTSVLYGKFSPKLLQAAKAPETDAPAPNA